MPKGTYKSLRKLATNRLSERKHAVRQKRAKSASGNPEAPAAAGAAVESEIEFNSTRWSRIRGSTRSREEYVILADSNLTHRLIISASGT